MLLRHSIYYLAGRGLPAIIAFLAAAIYTRLLSPNEYGTLALLFLFVTFLDVLFFQWARLCLIRFYPVYIGAQITLIKELNRGSRLAAIGALAAMLVAVIIASDTLSSVYFVLALLIVWVQARFDFRQEILRSKLEPLRYGLAAGLRSIVTFGAGVLLVVKGYGVIGVLLGALLGPLIAALLFPLKIGQHHQNDLYNNPRLSELLKYGYPLAFALAVSFVVAATDRVLLGWILNRETVGIYSAGYDITHYTLSVLMSVVNLAAYPLIMRTIGGEDRTETNERLRQNGVLILSVALLGAAFFGIAASNLANIVLGEAFREEAARLIPWIAIATAIGGIRAYHYDLAFHVKERSFELLLIVAVTALTNIVLSLLLIPIFGAMGAAYSTVIAYSLSLVASMIIGQKIGYIIKLRIKDGLQVASFTMVSAIAMWLIQSESGIINLILQGSAGVGAFVVMALVTNFGNTRTYIKNVIGDWQKGA